MSFTHLTHNPKYGYKSRTGSRECPKVLDRTILSSHKMRARPVKGNTEAEGDGALSAQDSMQATLD